jgi:hypothetical protein
MHDFSVVIPIIHKLEQGFPYLKGMNLERYKEKLQCARHLYGAAMWSIFFLLRFSAVSIFCSISHETDPEQGFPYPKGMNFA